MLKGDFHLRFFRLGNPEDGKKDDIVPLERVDLLVADSQGDEIVVKEEF